MAERVERRAAGRRRSRPSSASGRRRPCGRSTSGSARRCAGTRSAACRPATISPISASAIASAPSSPGSHASSTAALCSCSHALPHGRPATSTSTTGVPVASTARRAPPARRAGRATTRSRLSPLVQSSVSPALSPTHEDGDVGRGSERDRLVEPVARLAVDVAAAREATRVAEPCAQRVEDRRRDGQRVAELDPVRQLIEKTLPPGAGPSRSATRHAPDSCSRRAGCAARRRSARSPRRWRRAGERQDAVVLEQHEALVARSCARAQRCARCRPRRRPRPRRRTAARRARARTSSRARAARQRRRRLGEQAAARAPRAAARRSSRCSAARRRSRPRAQPPPPRLRRPRGGDSASSWRTAK